MPKYNNPRRTWQYSSDFKVNVVQLSFVVGVTIKSVAEKLDTHPFVALFRLLGVSKSGYYDWRQRQPSKRDIEDAELNQKIQQIFTENKGRYGSPRIFKALQKQGYNIGKKCAAVAFANKTVRTAFAMLTQGTEYKANLLAA